MRSFALTSVAALCLLIGACSKDEPQARTPETVGNTQLRIDTRSGEVSYEGESGGSSTSITVGGDDDKPNGND